MRKVMLILVVAALATAVGTVLVRTAGAATASTPASRVVVPKVIGMRMDRATRTLHQCRLRVNEECSGLFGCIIKSRWWVCEQSPRAGKRVARYSVVVIY